MKDILLGIIAGVIVFCVPALFYIVKTGGLS